MLPGTFGKIYEFVHQRLRFATNFILTENNRYEVSNPAKWHSKIKSKFYAKIYSFPHKGVLHLPLQIPLIQFYLIMFKTTIYGLPLHSFDSMILNFYRAEWALNGRHR
jgi:hypothetical protein